MNRTTRRILFLLVVVGVLAVVSLTSRAAPDLSRDKPNAFLKDKTKLVSECNLESTIDFPFQVGCRVPDVDAPRTNSALVMLARNSELDDVIKSMQSLERRFNQWFNYPWVFLNDEEFTDEFRKTVKLHTDSEVEFGLISSDQWEFPQDINAAEFNEFVQSQGDRTVMYGNLPSYHKMCRYYSYYFYKHPLVQKRDWYWRVEPNVEFFCDLTYDPFVEMEKHNKKYGFNVLIDELYYTIPGLFRETRSFIKSNSIKVQDTWELFVDTLRHTVGKNWQKYDGKKKFRNILENIEKNVYIEKLLETKKKNENYLSQVSDELLDLLFDRASERPALYEDRLDREDYNLCHFWSNFEIARTDVFNSPVYEKYFRHLEKSGGFYKERWGDAPIHSLAVAMMLGKEEIHYFRDIGYRHSSIGHCPRNSPENQLPYSPRNSKYNPQKIWDKPDGVQKNGVGCRCQCPYNMRKVEDSGSSCVKNWAKLTDDKYKQHQPVDLNYWEEQVTSKINRHLSKGGDLGDSIVDKILNTNE